MAPAEGPRAGGMHAPRALTVIDSIQNSSTWLHFMCAQLPMHAWTTPERRIG